MNDLQSLEENLEMLLQHKEEILSNPAYYNSRIRYKPESAGHGKVGSIPLGPYLEFWQQVPVNYAGKLLLTYELLGKNVRHLGAFSDEYPERFRCSNMDFEEESGFRYKKPLPGISRYQLQDIMYRYMVQFEKKVMPLGAPLSLVIAELKESQPQDERASATYAKLRQALKASVAQVTDNDGFYYEPEKAAQDAHTKYYDSWQPPQGAVAFRVQQEKDLSLQLVITFAVPVKHLSYNLETGKKRSAVELNDMMIDCLALLDVQLQRHDFRKVKSYTSVSGGGLEATYNRVINSPEEMLHTTSLERFANLVKALHQTVEEQGLLP